VSCLQRCKCGAVATHEAYDATSDGHPSCADCLPTFAGGMDGDEKPYELKYVSHLQEALRTIEGRDESGTP
jgi:hypothetical protein